MGDQHKTLYQPASADGISSRTPYQALDSNTSQYSGFTRSGNLAGVHVPRDNTESGLRDEDLVTPNVPGSNIGDINSTYTRVDVPARRTTSITYRNKYGTQVVSTGAAHIPTIREDMVHDSGNRRVHTMASDDNSSSLSNLIHSLESMEQKSLPSNIAREDESGLYGRGDNQLSFADVGVLTPSLSDMKMGPLEDEPMYANKVPFLERPKKFPDRYSVSPEKEAHRTLTGNLDSIEQKRTLQPDPLPRLSRPSSSSHGYSSMTPEKPVPIKRTTSGGKPSTRQRVSYKSSISAPENSEHDSAIHSPPTVSSATESKKVLTQVLPGQDARPKEPKIRSSQSSQSVRLPPARSTSTDTKTRSLPPSNQQYIEEEEADKQYRLLFQRATLHEKNGKLEEALADYQMALYFEMQAKGEGDINVAKTQRVLGRVCRKLNNFPSAISHLERALEICNQCVGVDSDILWNIHDDLAQSYALTNLDKEVFHYERAIEILILSTDIPPERIAHMHNNAGIAYNTMKQYQKAKEHLLKARQMMSVMVADQLETAKVHKSLGDLYVKTNDDSRAMAEFNSCLDIVNRNKNKGAALELLLPVHTSLADIYEKQGDMETARKHRQAASNASGEVDDLESTKNSSVSANQDASTETTRAVIASQKQVDLAQKYQSDGQAQKCIFHYQKAKEYLDSLPDDAQNTESVMNQMALICNNLGNAYRSVGRVREAKELVEKALRLRRFLYGTEACDALATTLFNLGYIYSQVSSDARQAILYHNEALDMYMKLGGPKKYEKWIVGLHRSIASNQYSVGDVNGSIEHYEAAKTIINQQGGDLNQLQAICNNVGNSYKSIKNYPKAEENFLMSLDLAKMLSDQEPNNPVRANDIATCENNIGCLYQETDEFQKAIQHHTNSLRIREQISHDHGEALTDLPSSLHNLANAYFAAGAYNDALALYQREEQMRRDLGDDPREALLSLSRLYDKMGRLDEATECLSRVS